MNTTSSTSSFVRLPVLPGSKRPLVRDWPNLRPDSPEISIPFQVFKRAGKPINTGYRLDGLVVIDCDSPDAVMWWLKREIHTRYVSMGRRDRASYWYRAPSDWEGGTFRPEKDVEVRSGSGAQCLVPPSIHPETMAPYVWLGPAPQSPSELPVLPIDQLDYLMRLRPAREHTEGNGGQWDCWPEGERDEWLTKAAGWLREKGASEAALLRAIPALNQALCEPPISDPERVARSVGRYQDIQWEDEDDNLPEIDSLRGLHS